MGRVAIIGDVGGHLAQLRSALAGLGAQGPKPQLPADLTVIQVGDLVDRGPDSTGVLDLVGQYLEDQPGQWVQLIGNHEGQHLPGGTPFWRERLDESGIGTLRFWWATERIQVAAAIATADGDELLLTHAGLTVDAWQELGEPMTAATAAMLLNTRPEPLLWSGDGFTSDSISGPLWAEAGAELYEPWLRFHALGGFVPFGQVHGHSAIVSYRDQALRCAERVRERATVDWAARHVRLRVGGRTFTGVDPKHGRAGTAQWRPLVLEGATVLVGSQRAGHDVVRPS